MRCQSPLPSRTPARPRAGSECSRRGANVTQLSASAHRVAFVQDINSQCERLVVWQPARRKATRLPRTGACSDPSSTGQGVSDLLLAGKRLVWIEFGGGNFRELVVHSTRLDAKKPRAARHTDFLAHRVDSQWGHDGTYIDGLRGHPSSRNKQELVVWNTWDGCFYDPGLIGNECEPPAELLPSEAALVSWNRTLWRLAGNGGEAVATGAAAMSIVAAGDERIAVKSGPVPRTGPGGVAPVAEPAGTLTMVGPDGDVSSSFTLPAGTYYGTELTNNAFTLATLRDGRARALQHHERGTRCVLPDQAAEERGQAALRAYRCSQGDSPSTSAASASMSYGYRMVRASRSGRREPTARLMRASCRMGCSSRTTLVRQSRARRTDASSTCLALCWTNASPQQASISGTPSPRSSVDRATVS